MHHEVVIIGGGAAGISTAARLRRLGRDVALVEPSDVHHYQPLWTLIGGGRAPAGASARPMRKLVPRGTHWLRTAAVGVDPFERRVDLADGTSLRYARLVVCPGLQLDWHRLDGLVEALGHDGVASNYSASYAPLTWEFIQRTRSGTAVFTMPSGPIKCGGAPQKIAYLAADHWRETGVLKDIDIHLVLPTPAMFAVPEYASVLEGVARRYGIHVHLESEAVAVRSSRDVVVRGPDGVTTLPYSFAHLVPPQSAPDWIKSSALAGLSGYVDVDGSTLRHNEFPDVFALGDVAGTPNSKTGAAVRKQVPVVVANLLASLAGHDLPGVYDGYASCPITTGRRTLLLAEFDYTGRPRPSIPFLNTMREITDHTVFKRRVLPWLYWGLMLRGLA
ncbi:NAD(P)/FAD-dependent oxidoreductase [Saccharothrix variisporea]|uniref:Sulfide:quinone oxidoreductase n=1 Tax=Saccharothrix variisporea TaxID=543527 RepID=A0A495X3X0_9PSEU|nr:FAD/NAD(P)-binding oxidoreductase [Saccharothrix variisporea]RKT68702.1 sulfide:quinone oxidoreductase [Saccharothrix variisporea]